MQTLFNIIILGLIMTTGLLAMQVDRLSYEISREKAARAYQLVQSAKPENRQQAEIEAGRLMKEARSLCAGAFLTVMLSTAKKGPCSEMVESSSSE
ncbi:hypothetical protein [Azospirillum palustre]